MVSYPGISAGDFDPFRQFEFQVLSPERRERIAKMQPLESTAPRAVDADTEGVTPQGLLLTLNGSNWKTLRIAQTARGESTVAIEDVKTPLKSALLSNQLFLVVSDPQQFRAAIGSISALVDLRDWIFDFDPSNALPEPARLLRPVRGCASRAGLSVYSEEVFGSPPRTRLELLHHLPGKINRIVQAW